MQKYHPDTVDLQMQDSTCDDSARNRRRCSFKMKEGLTQVDPRDACKRLFDSRWRTNRSNLNEESKTTPIVPIIGHTNRPLQLNLADMLWHRYNDLQQPYGARKRGDLGYIRLIQWKDVCGKNREHLYDACALENATFEIQDERDQLLFCSCSRCCRCYLKS